MKLNQTNLPNKIDKENGKILKKYRLVFDK